MSLLDQIKLDIEQITSNSEEYAISATFTNPAGTETATVNVIHSKHHLGVDTDGNRINVKNAHIAFAENNLSAAGLASMGTPYTIRNAAQEVALTDHRVMVADSTGVVKNYIIRESYPDEMVGLIVCILGDFE